MTNPPEPFTDAALRAVGRTMVNFQRLEHSLKLAARLGPMQGPPHKMQHDIARRLQRAETLTLGQAIQAWLGYGRDTQAETAWTPDLLDVSMQVTFSLEPHPETDDAHARALASLLETRNALVHTRLATFPWQSQEACEALVLELNAVNAAIGEQLEYVTSLLKSFAEAHAELADSLREGLALVAAGSDGGEGSVSVVAGQSGDP